MPAAVVKTERDERLWDQAKALVREQYADVGADTEQFWRLVMGVYQRMHGEKPMRKALVLMRRPPQAPRRRALLLLKGAHGQCPKCKSRNCGLAAPDFETMRCDDCRHNWPAKRGRCDGH